MKICNICKKEFKEKNMADKYCGILCLNASITDEEQEKIIKTIDDKGVINCPICGRHKKFLIHKRMNGSWYLWQEYHYNNNQDSILTCYYCNLWEMNFRKNNNIYLSPLEHRKIIELGRRLGNII